MFLRAFAAHRVQTIDRVFPCFSQFIEVFLSYTLSLKFPSGESYMNLHHLRQTMTSSWLILIFWKRCHPNSLFLSLSSPSDSIYLISTHVLLWSLYSLLERATPADKMYRIIQSVDGQKANYEERGKRQLVRITESAINDMILLFTSALLCKNLASD